MAFRMPTPFMHKTGIFFLNVRLPCDLALKVKGTKLTLPVGEALVSIVATDKVFLSLRTKDKNVARERFLAAYGALNRHFAALRAGSTPLTHRQIVALAGEVYRSRVKEYENDPVYVPHGWIADRQNFEREVDFWRKPLPDEDGHICEDDGSITEESARFFAAIARPYGPQLLA